MTYPSLRLVLTLHQHQPIGNLETVNETVYHEAYSPLIETLADYPSLPLNLHTSGSLLDWLVARHPEYVQRLRELATAGRVEIMGGAYHDPILPMLPRADRCGQINALARRLGQLFGQIPRGMWLPERIWDPGLTADLAECNIEHAVLDDYHFQAAGLAEDQLRGYYLTESEGQLIALFAGCEQLRYLIPFAEPEETIAYLRGIAQASPGSVIVYADDAEKFGHWPGMHERVYGQGWLRRFLDALAANRDWLRVTTLGECIDHVAPLGKIYVPEGSYREMHTWSTLADWRRADATIVSSSAVAAEEKHAAIAEIAHSTHIAAIAASSVVQGTWRNFRAKYAEVDEMYCRMHAVSRRCQAADEIADVDLQTIGEARQALYRAQCGCAYWHGIFGGVYMSHLRQAVYHNLIRAEQLLDKAEGRSGSWLTASIDDFNLDVHKELLLANPWLQLLIAPDRGGQIYELDVRDIGANLLATLARRPEPYHPQAATGTADARLVYDRYPRKSLLDHFFDPHATLDEIVAGPLAERGDFVAGRYRARLRRVPAGVTAQLSRQATALGYPITVTKQLTLWAERSVIDIHYQLAGLPAGRPLKFAVEFNFAGLPPGCADRYFVDAQNRVLADFGQRLDLAGAASLRLVDRWLGLDVGFSTAVPAGFWAYPVETVSRSQRGLETIHQSVAVLPHWLVVGDAQGRWEVKLQLSLTTATSPRGPSGIQAPNDAWRDEAPRRTDDLRQYIIDGPHPQPVPKSTTAHQARRVYEG